MGDPRPIETVSLILSYLILSYLILSYLIFLQGLSDETIQLGENATFFYNLWEIALIAAEEPQPLPPSPSPGMSVNVRITITHIFNI
eukprot:SAG31_NODE_831_length_11669_cov_3.410026_2_plen_87_part_00